MSLIFEKKLDGKTMQLEVTRDGELVFLDHDISYDLAACEFGYKKTDSVYLHESWNDDPVGTLLVKLSRNVIEEKTIALIAIEWAEHVLPIFEYWHSRSRRPRFLLKASKEFILGKMSYLDFQALRRKHNDLGSGYGSRQIGPQTGSILARLASYSASTVALYADKSKSATFDMTHGVANLSHSASGYDFCLRNDLSTAGKPVHRVQGLYGGATTFDRSQAIKDAEKVESNWQLRRFVDVMEALGQGLPWPPLEATP